MRSCRGGLVALVSLALYAGRASQSRPAPRHATTPDGPGSGGCVDVTVEPPCTLTSLTAVTSPADPPGETSFVLLYHDARGREIQPYHLRARPEDGAALETFFRTRGPVTCSGWWVSAPCNDTPHLGGFPTPPVGEVFPM